PDSRIRCAERREVGALASRSWRGVRGRLRHGNACCCARDGPLWAASNAGLFRCARGAWVQNDVADGLPSSRVTDVREDASGQILAMTAEGTSAFQPDADDDPPRTFIRPLADKEQNVREGAAVRLAFTGRDK